jgi:hypothetical protein
MNKKNIQTRALPTIDYDPLLHAIAHEISGRNAMEHDQPEREALRRAGHITSQREKFEAWAALGDHYAETLDSPDTPADVHNALAEELIDLAHKANLSIDSPDVVRLLYPLLRERAARMGRGAGGSVAAFEPEPDAEVSARRAPDLKQVETLKKNESAGASDPAEEIACEPPPLTPELAVEVMDTILPRLADEDEALRALIVLVRALTYERDVLKRETTCLVVTSHAFSKSRACAFAATPAKPVPSRIIVAGSGTAATVFKVRLSMRKRVGIPPIGVPPILVNADS